MEVHYLVIWTVGRDMSTRRETPIDLLVDARDKEKASWRYQQIKGAVSNGFNVKPEHINIVNICRL